MLPTNADTVTLPRGYSWRTLIGWGDALYERMGPFDPDTLTRAEQERRFGQNNDMLAVFPGTYAFPPPRTQARDGDRMLMCANNEYFEISLMFPGVARREDFTPAQVETAYSGLGCTVVTLVHANGGWRLQRDAAPGAGLNRRITPFTPMVFAGPAANHPWIAAAAAYVNGREAGLPHEANPQGAVRCGTFSNCAGGQTPWGTYLTSEENFNLSFVITDPNAAALQEARRDPVFVRDCDTFRSQANPPGARLVPPQYDLVNNPYGQALYGWVCEIDPYDPTWAPRKRTAIGRKKGECATTALTRDGRVAVYRGDDQVNEFIYKFVSSGRFDPANRTANRDLLDTGVLHAARCEEDGSGRWIAITLDAANAAARAANREAFRDEGDLMVRAREAARLLGATPMDRPEDIEAVLDANWVGIGPVLIACTNNFTADLARPGSPSRERPGAVEPQSNMAGHVLRIDEDGGDVGAATFRWDIFALAGDPGSESGVSPVRGTQRTAFVSPNINGAPTFTGDRFACPDNICVDSTHNVWIATDSSDLIFSDCNDGVVAFAAGDGAREARRFLVGPLGAEICGPTMALDERAFFVALQHPGENDVAGNDIGVLRWQQGQRPPSNFPDGGNSWPRSAVVVITRDDGGKIGS